MIGTGSEESPLDVSHRDWGNAEASVQDRYSHVHADGECVKNRFGPKCGAVTVFPRPQPGTLYVDYEGNAWRLRGYHLSMSEVGPDGQDVYKADYVVNRPNGMTSSGNTLPEGACQVWAP